MNNQSYLFAFLSCLGPGTTETSTVLFRKLVGGDFIEKHCPFIPKYPNSLPINRKYDIPFHLGVVKYQVKEIFKFSLERSFGGHLRVE